MNKVEIIIKCDESDFEYLRDVIDAGIRNSGACPYPWSKKPCWCGEDADCDVCIDRSVEILEEGEVDCIHLFKKTKATMSPLARLEEREEIK